MSENQKETIKKSLEKKYFHQENPSAKETDERRREVGNQNSIDHYLFKSVSLI